MGRVLFDAVKAVILHDVAFHMVLTDDEDSFCIAADLPH